MRRSPRIYVRAAGGGFDVVCRIPHPMSEENYLSQVTFRRNGDLHAEILLGRHVSADPAVGTRFADLAEGDTIIVSWIDIRGSSGETRRRFDGKADS